MDAATVVGFPGSSAAKFAHSLADLLRVPVCKEDQGGAAPACVRVVDGLADAPASDLVVIVDDAPLNYGLRGPGAGALFTALVRGRAAGTPIAVLASKRAQRAWLDVARREGLAKSVGPLRRVFLAAGDTEEAHAIGRRIAAGLDLPINHPEQSDGTAEGWGRRYNTAAAGERWLVHTGSWHAVEALMERADLVVHLAASTPVTPVPQRTGWRVMFSPWFRRYPKVEAGLLAKELESHAHTAPVFTLRSEAEVAALLAGLLTGRENPV